jgi:hypothetical protein
MRVVGNVATKTFKTSPKRPSKIPQPGQRATEWSTLIFKVLGVASERRLLRSKTSRNRD